MEPPTAPGGPALISSPSFFSPGRTADAFLCCSERMTRASQFAVRGDLWLLVAQQTVGRATGDPHGNILSEETAGSRIEVHHAVAGAVPVPLVLFFGLAVHVDFQSLAHHFLQRV